MKRTMTGLLLTLAVSVSATVGPSASASGAPLDFNKLHDGLPAARPDSEVGVLGSSVNDPMAVYYQSLLDQVESKAYGLSLVATQAPVEQAEQIYYVESIALGMIRTLLNDTSIRDSYEREMLTYRAIQIYKSARFSGERIFEVMIRMIDTAKPGTSGIQLPTDAGTGVVYSPNYRLEYPISPAEQKTLFNQKMSEFIAAGGDLSEIKILSLATASELPDRAMVEFVEMPNGEIRFTQGSAGHIIMARGKKVISAGTMLLVKDKTGKFQFAAVSNSSGSYKPDLMPVADFADRLVQILNIPADNVILTKGEPTSTQTVKILLKAAGVAPDTIKTEIGVLKDYGRAAQESPVKFIPDGWARARACRAVFN